MHQIIATLLRAMSDKYSESYVYKLFHDKFGHVNARLISIILATLASLYVGYLVDSFKDSIEKSQQTLAKIQDSLREIHSEENIRVFIAANDIINNELITLRDTTGAQRISVFLLHNGVSSFSGVPFIKFSKTHEVTSPGVSSLLAEQQGLPINMLYGVINAMSDGNCFIQRRVETIGFEPTRQFFKKTGGEYISACPLIVDGSLDGIVILERFSKCVDGTASGEGECSILVERYITETFVDKMKFIMHPDLLIDSINSKKR